MFLNNNFDEFSNECLFIAICINQKKNQEYISSISQAIKLNDIFINLLISTWPN